MERWKAAQYTPLYTPAGCSAEQEEVYDTELFETAVRRSDSFVAPRQDAMDKPLPNGSDRTVGTFAAVEARVCRIDSRTE